MKLLLSAYSCEPGKGSESGVGWHWAEELSALGYEVWVLTRSNNREPIEEALDAQPARHNLHFIYYDLPKWASWWKIGGHFVRFYYLLWQIGAYQAVKRAHRDIGFDAVHHLTFGTVRQPSFLGGLGVPFIFGPAGGGERAPWPLRRGYGVSGWLADLTRDVLNGFIKYDPTMRLTYRQAHRIYLKSPQSRDPIPREWQDKARCHFEMGIDPPEGPEEDTAQAEAPGLRVLYVGRFLYWKGMHLGLQAFASLLSADPNAHLTLVGKGKSESLWRRQARRLGIADHIDWVPWVEQNELGALYRRHDVFLFPSLHEASGNVVLEALAHGLPVVCLDLGGPALIVNESCGRVILTTDRGRAAVVGDLAAALTELRREPDTRQRLSQGARARVATMTWRAQVEQLYRDAFGAPPVERSARERVLSS